MIVKQETKHKRNETKQAETKRDTTETKRKKNKKTSLNKKTKQTLTKRHFFHMRQQFTICQWQIEKPLKFTGRFGYGRKN